jgi:carboxylesterase type B
MMKLWTAFARTGNPGQLDQRHEDHWPAWLPAKDEYLYLDHGVQIRTGFSRLPASK